MRTLFRARGIAPASTLRVPRLGGGSNMLAALEKGATDGFTWSAPQPQIAVQKGIGEIIIDPFDRVVPELSAPREPDADDLRKFGALRGRRDVEQRLVPLIVPHQATAAVP